MDQGYQRRYLSNGAAGDQGMGLDTVKTASEHAETIRAAIRAAEADGFVVEMSSDCGNCGDGYYHEMKVWDVSGDRGFLVAEND